MYSFRNKMHVLWSFAGSPQLLKERREGAADSVTTDKLGHGGIEREKSGSSGVEEIGEGIDVGVIERSDKGAEEFVGTFRRERVGRCASSEQVQHEDERNKAGNGTQWAISSGA